MRKNNFHPGKFACSKIALFLEFDLKCVLGKKFNLPGYLSPEMLLRINFG